MTVQVFEGVKVVFPLSSSLFYSLHKLFCHFCVHKWREHLGGETILDHLFDSSLAPLFVGRLFTGYKNSYKHFSLRCWTTSMFRGHRGLYHMMLCSLFPSWGCNPKSKSCLMLKSWCRCKTCDWVYVSSRLSHWALYALCQLSQSVKTIFKEPLRFCLVCNLKNLQRFLKVGLIFTKLESDFFVLQTDIDHKDILTFHRVQEAAVLSFGRNKCW